MYGRGHEDDYSSGEEEDEEQDESAPASTPTPEVTETRAKMMLEHAKEKLRILTEMMKNNEESIKSGIRNNLAISVFRVREATELRRSTSFLPFIYPDPSTLLSQHRVIAAHSQLYNRIATSSHGYLYFAAVLGTTQQEEIGRMNLRTGEVEKIGSPSQWQGGYRSLISMAATEGYLALGFSGMVVLLEEGTWKQLKACTPSEGEFDLMINSVAFYRHNGELRLLANHNTCTSSVNVFSVPSGVHLFSQTIPAPVGTRINYPRYMCAVGDLEEAYFMAVTETSFMPISAARLPSVAHMAAFSRDSRYVAVAAECLDGEVLLDITNINTPKRVALPMLCTPLSEVIEELRNASACYSSPFVARFSRSGLCLFGHETGLFRVFKPDNPAQLQCLLPPGIEFSTSQQHWGGADFDPQSGDLIVGTTAGIVSYKAVGCPPLTYLCQRVIRASAKLCATALRMLPADLQEPFRPSAPISATATDHILALHLQDWNSLQGRTKSRYLALKKATEELAPAANIDPSTLDLPPPPPDADMQPMTREALAAMLDEPLKSTHAAP